MKFEEVLPFFKEGKKIKRTSWGEDQFIFILNDNGNLFIADNSTIIRMDDSFLIWINSDDWEIVE